MTVEGILWLLPLAALLSGFRDRRFPWYLFAASMPLFGSPPGGPYLAVLEAMVAVVLLWSLVTRSASPRTQLDLPVLVFVLISLLSLVPLVYQPPSWSPRALLRLLGSLQNVETRSLLYCWRAALSLLLGWGLFVSVRRVFEVRKLPTLGVALAAGMAPSLIVGLVEHAGWIDLGFYRPIGGAEYDPRLHSLFFHSGWFAEYVVLAAPLAIACCAAGRGRGVRFLGLLIAVLVPPTILLTAQRGAWVSLTVQVMALAMLIAWRRPRLWGFKRLALALGAALLAILLVATVLSKRPETREMVEQRFTRLTKDLSGRGHIWRDTVRMAEERPVLGWGLGTFRPAFDAWAGSLRERRFAWLTPHQQYLMLAVERGLLGLLAFGWVGAVAAHSLWKMRADPSGNRREASLLSRGLLVSGIGFAVYGLVQYVFFLKVLEWLFWMLLGIAAVAIPGDEFEPEGSPPRGRTWFVLGGVGLLLVLRMVTVEPFRHPSDRSVGLYAREQSAGRTMRWADGWSAQRVRWQDEVLVLPLANGHPRAASHPVQVEVRVDGDVMFEGEVREGWKEHRLNLGPPDRDEVVVEINAHPTFRPFFEFRRHPELPPSRDIRRLGIAVGEISWEASARVPTAATVR